MGAIAQATFWESNTVGAQRAETGIVASTTQSQGERPLEAPYNVVATVANANDVVTLPPASAGRRCTIMNAGANTLQVYPASGDSIDGGSVDASVTIAAAGSTTFDGDDGTNWTSS